MKYTRFCENPACKEKYRDIFKKSMISKYGKIHLLDDPEKQKEMLAKRKISGTYKWSDNTILIPFTGTYEEHFLRFIDTILKWKSSDILAPSPHVYTYKYDSKDHFYIPDFFVPSLNLEIEIKSSVRMDDQNTESKEKEIEKIKLMKSCESLFDYIVIFDKKYDDFIKLVKEEAD